MQLLQTQLLSHLQSLTTVALALSGDLLSVSKELITKHSHQILLTQPQSAVQALLPVVLRLQIRVTHAQMFSILQLMLLLLALKETQSVAAKYSTNTTCKTNKTPFPFLACSKERNARILLKLTVVRQYSL